MHLTKRFLLSALSIGVALSAANSATLAHAQAVDPMEAYYASTWEYKDPEGMKHFNINKDKSVQIKLSDGRVFDGTWEHYGKEVCFNVGSDRACAEGMLNRSPGEAWSGAHEELTYTSVLLAARVEFGDR